MTQIIPQAFNPGIDPNSAYKIVNSLAIDYLQFATFSHHYHRLFGVRTESQEGTDGSVDDFIVNNCLREAVWTTLHSIQSQTEALLGYNLSPRYHTETAALSPSFRVKTRFPGIEKVDVVSNIAYISDEDETEVPLLPYVQYNAPILTDENLRTVAKVDRRVVSNPNEVILRSSLDGGAIITLPAGVAGYPKRHADGDWLLLINTREHTLSVDEEINVQNRLYVFVDVDPIVSDTDTVIDSVVCPVYSGTIQKIPLAKPVERTPDNKDRYWFHSFTMVDPAFFVETVDLVKGEFYKLVQTVDFRRFQEVRSYGRATNIRPSECVSCEDHSWRMTAKVIDPELGIIEFSPVGAYRTDSEGGETYVEQKTPHIPFKSYQNIFVTFSYKTNPLRLPARVKQDIPLVRRGIIHRVAAELPVSDCGCTMKTGFIAEQQRAYQTTTQLTNGAIISNLRYGSLHGQAVYAEMMQNVTLMNVQVI